MKKTLILLSIIASSVAYSAVSSVLDVNATLIKPLSIDASTKDLQGSIPVAGGQVNLSTVDLLLTGVLSSKVKITAPKDVTLYNLAAKGTDTPEIILQSKFSSGTIVTTGTTLETALALNAAGELTTTYSLEGTVTPVKITGAKVNFVGNTDITVAYN